MSDKLFNLPPQSNDSNYINKKIFIAFSNADGYTIFFYRPAKKTDAVYNW